MKFYSWILNLVTPLVKFLSKLHSPYSHKCVKGSDYYNVRDIIDVGTIFLTRTNGELANLINPGLLKHAAIYIGDCDGTGIRYVVEATLSGTKKTDLVSFMLTKDVVIGCRPKFLTDEERALIPTEAKRIIGVPYDFVFDYTESKRFYCYEAVAYLLKMVRPEINIKKKEVIKGKSIYSFESFLEDSNLFTKIFHIGEK